MENGGTLRAIDPQTYRNVRSVDRIVPSDIEWRATRRKTTTLPNSEAPLLAVAIATPPASARKSPVKALATGEPQRRSRVMLIGNHDGIVDTDPHLRPRHHVPTRLRCSGSSGHDRRHHPRLRRQHDQARRLHPRRTQRPPAGRATAGWIDRAVAWAEAGSIDGFIIAPVDSSSFQTRRPAKIDPVDAPAQHVPLAHDRQPAP